MSRTVNGAAVMKVLLPAVARSLMALTASRSVFARVMSMTLLLVVEGVLSSGIYPELERDARFTSVSPDTLKEPAYTVSSKVRPSTPESKSSE